MKRVACTLLLLLTGCDTWPEAWSDLGLEPPFDTGATTTSEAPAAYEGGWSIDACRDDLVSTGDQVGEVTADFALTDQYGEELHLHDFCGREVLLVSSAMWCGACQAEAQDLADLYATWEAEGFVLITLLGENTVGETPTRRDLRDWADAFAIEHPVVADEGWAVTARFVDGGTLALPTMHLLAPGAEVVARDTWVSEDDIVDYLP